MVSNAVVANLRSATKDNSDADFLSRLLKFSVSKFEANVTKGWGSWMDALTWTLIEWKQNYKIDSNLNSGLRKLTQGKERPSLRDAHFTALTDLEAVENLLRRTSTDAVTVHLLRVWECCFSPSGDVGKDALTAVLLPGWNSEGWESLMTITSKYVKSFYASNPTGVLFKSTHDKFSALIINFVKSHSSIFVESSVGETVRSLALTVHTNVKEFLRSPLFREAVEKLMRFLKYTLENMHTLTPILARFLCSLCDLIREGKGSGDCWQELCNLLVLRVLTMAISNPLVYGVTDACGAAAMNVLKEMGRLLHHIWLGKTVDTGDLSEVTWLNDVVLQWQGELQAAFNAMISARKVVPKAVTLPRALIMYDLTEISKSFQSSSLPLSHYAESPSITKIKGGKASPKPPLPGRRKEIDAADMQEETDIVTFGGMAGEQTLLVDDGQIFGTISKVKRGSVAMMKPVEIFEDSTPTVGSLPPVFGGYMSEPPLEEDLLVIKTTSTSDNPTPVTTEKPTQKRSPAPSPVRLQTPTYTHHESQTITRLFTPRTTQTDTPEFISKFTQVRDTLQITQIVQTDPTNTSLKQRVSIRDEVYVKDKNVDTYFTWAQIATDKALAESELVDLREYQRLENVKMQRLSDEWSNKFQELVSENTDLKEEMQSLKEELERMQQVKEESPKSLRASYADFSQTLKGQVYIDDRLLRKMDPRNYIPGDFSRTVGYFPQTSPIKSRRQNSVISLK